MHYSGFCIKQNKNYTVNFEQISRSALEDLNKSTILGRLNCNYAGLTGCCDHPSQCSILNPQKKS